MGYKFFSALPPCESGVETAKSSVPLAVKTALDAGQIVVLPTDTVYGIGTTVHQSSAINALIAAKGRGRQMPPPVLVGRIADLHTFAEPSSLALTLAEHFWPGALTIILPAPQISWDLGDLVGSVAVRMPAQNQTLEILHYCGPIAVTSANLTGQPPATTVEQARTYFGNKVAVYVDGGSSPASNKAVASTIIDTTGERLRILRQGVLTRAQIDEKIPGLEWE